MLFHDAGLSWLHFVLAFILVGAIAAEAVILRLPVDARAARLLLRVDLFYAVSAVLLILAGVSRVIWGAKGWAYYQVQPFFWAKMATFAAIGLLSITPTLTFMRWVKEGSANPGHVAPPQEVKGVRRLALAEILLVPLLLLFAALMARDIGG
jgi:putative membrane protein